MRARAQSITLCGRLSEEEPVPAAVVVSDAQKFVLRTVHPAERSLEPGRWYFQAQRNWLSLSTPLREQGLHSDALWAQSRGQR